tara:strand:+ start:331 stop:1599 length:1269 start_codon:yes stop_codon:yes gene_type:complete
MIKGEKIRLDIHNILYSIYKLNKTINNRDIQKIINQNKKDDISLLNNVTLNSMRFHLHSCKIINKYIKKKIRLNEKILLISAITQIVFLDFKEYAVINCSVEIAKRLKIYHGFINSTLKNISKNKKSLKKISIKFDDLPFWFKDKTTSWSTTDKKRFLKNFNKEPSLHIVFKDPDKLKSFEENLISTSEVSGFLIKRKNINEIKSFKKGEWWVQDFSSFFPLQSLQIKDKNKKFLDACAAPGGKSFQLLSKNHKLVINDKSENRIKTLKSNLERLNFNTNVLNKDFTKFKNKEKYDFIIIDAPCSSVGTIRKNPEIFFKREEPNFKDLLTLQQNMLEKASDLLNSNGLIIYMVCSFLDSETENQVNSFLYKHSDFEIFNFDLLSKNRKYSKLTNKNFVKTLPSTITGGNIDGYFAAFLKKIK